MSLKDVKIAEKDKGDQPTDRPTNIAGCRVAQHATKKRERKKDRKKERKKEKKKEN